MSLLNMTAGSCLDLLLENVKILQKQNTFSCRKQENKAADCVPHRLKINSESHEEGDTMTAFLYIIVQTWSRSCQLTCQLTGMTNDMSHSLKGLKKKGLPTPPDFHCCVHLFLNEWRRGFY